MNATAPAEGLAARLFARPGAAHAARPAAGHTRPRRLRQRLRGDRPPLRQGPVPLRGRDRRRSLGGRHPGRLLEGAARPAAGLRSGDRPQAVALPDRPQHRPQRPPRPAAGHGRADRGARRRDRARQPRRPSGARRSTELMQRLRDLPEPQRAAIVMRELEGLSHDEIAAALGLSGGGARQTIYRARQALRDGLGTAVRSLLPVLPGSGAVRWMATASAARARERSSGRRRRPARAAALGGARRRRGRGHRGRGRRRQRLARAGGGAPARRAPASRIDPARWRHRHRGRRRSAIATAARRPRRRRRPPPAEAEARPRPPPTACRLRSRRQRPRDLAAASDDEGGGRRRERETENEGRGGSRLR